MAFKVLKDIPSGRNQLVVVFYIGHCQGEQIFHTKCKLLAGLSNLPSQIQRARHWGASQDCVLVSGFCWYKEASQGTNHHPGQGVALRQQADSVGSSISTWSLGVRALHFSFSLYLFCPDLRLGIHHSRGLFKGAVTECSMCVNGSCVVKALPQIWRVWAKCSPQPGGTVTYPFQQPNLLYPIQHGTAGHGLIW